MSLQDFFIASSKVKNGTENYEKQKVELVVESKNRITGEVENEFLKISHILSDRWPFETDLYVSFENLIVNNVAISQYDIGLELAALLSLYFRKRFTFVGISRLEDRPHNPYKKLDKLVDPPLINEIFYSTHGRRQGPVDSIPLKDFNSFLNSITKAYSNQNFYLFIQAVKRYNFAIKIIDLEPELSFLSLVSAIEILSNKMEIGVSFSGLGSNWQGVGKIINENIKDPELNKKLKDKIIKNQYFISKKFKSFIKKYLPSDFWEYSDSEEDSGKAKKEDLDKYINSIYTQRSLTLHAGYPLPHTSWHMNGKTDIPFGLPVSEMGKPIKPRRAKEIRNLPTVMFIERMVNSILNNYYEKEIKFS